MTERGKLIEIADPYKEIRKNAETAPDWLYKDEAKYLYDKAVLLRDRLIDPIARLDRGRLPDPIIGFDDMRNFRTLAGYWLERDSVGLTSRIDFNTQHYIDAKTDEGKTVKAWKFGRWAQLETLTHEYVHLWQQTYGEHPVKRNTHNKEFIEKCESLGLHSNDRGQHYAIATEPFSILMRELGILSPDDVAKAPADLDTDWFKWLVKFWGQERKGTSTLKLWCCPECGMKVRMGIAGDPMLRHHTCETTVGHPVFLIPGIIYDATRHETDSPGK